VGVLALFCYIASTAVQNHIFITIKPEPGHNRTCPEIRGVALPTLVTFVEGISGLHKHTFFIPAQLPAIISLINNLDAKLRYNIYVADQFYRFVEDESNLFNEIRYGEQSIEKLNEHICNDLCYIRILESLYLYFDSTYVRKPFYSIEEL
jgi:hypothetical protein